MKKILLAIILLLCSISSYAQSDITKFLGIPVDGSKSEMIRQLKDKGFVSSDYYSDVLQGEFNGHLVNVYVVTNNNRVYRIMVGYQNTVTKAQIKRQFNNLCHQFESNENYISLEDCTIPDNEDVSYEMTVNSKEYIASYYQKLPESEEDMSVLFKEFYSELLTKYTEEEIRNESFDIESVIDEMLVDHIEKKCVWFTISEFRNEYYITMYYDNGYNKANGEDL